MGKLQSPRAPAEEENSKPFLCIFYLKKALESITINQLDGLQLYIGPVCWNTGNCGCIQWQFCPKGIQSLMDWSTLSYHEASPGDNRLDSIRFWPFLVWNLWGGYRYIFGSITGHQFIMHWFSHEVDLFLTGCTCWDRSYCRQRTPPRCLSMTISQVPLYFFRFSLTCCRVRFSFSHNYLASGLETCLYSSDILYYLHRAPPLSPGIHPILSLRLYGV